MKNWLLHRKTIKPEDTSVYFMYVSRNGGQSQVKSKLSYILAVLSIVFFSMFALTSNASAALPPLVPGSCGMIESEAYLLDGTGIGVERRYRLESGHVTYDPDVFFGVLGTEHAYTKNADGSVDYFFDGEAYVKKVSTDVSNATLIDNVTSIAGNAANQTDSAEFWRITARIHGVPGQTYNYTLDNTNLHEYLHYWLEDSSGNVIDSSLGDSNTANGWIFGARANNSTSSASGATSISGQTATPISYTIPASNTDGIVYLNILLFDPQAAWGSLDFSNIPDCPIDANDVVAAAPVNGLNGGTIPENVLSNDLLNGVVVDPAEVTLVPITTGPLTVNSDGTVDVAANTPEGSYDVTYEICEIASPTNCDTAIVTVIVSGSADLSVSKILDTAGPYTSGQTVTYTIVVTNSASSLSTATNVVVTDLPTNLTITTVSSTNCTSLPCTIPSLAVGASETITVQAVAP